MWCNARSSNQNFPMPAFCTAMSFNYIRSFKFLNMFLNGTWVYFQFIAKLLCRIFLHPDFVKETVCIRHDSLFLR